jgi:hypothetical protein
MGKIPLGVAAQAVLAYRPALQLKIGVAGIQLPPAQDAAQLLCVPNPARRPVSLLFSSFFKKLLTKPPPTAIISSVVNVVAFYAGVAQLVEQLICNQQVGGSNPSTSSTFSQLNTEEYPSGQRGQTVNLLASPSMVRIHPPPPRRSKVRSVQVSHPKGGRLLLCSLAPPFPIKPEGRLCGGPVLQAMYRLRRFFQNHRSLIPLRFSPPLLTVIFLLLSFVIWNFRSISFLLYHSFSAKSRQRAPIFFSFFCK